MSDDVLAKVFVLGGNADSLAVTWSLKEENGTIPIALVPIAQTPLGATFGQTWQNVGIAADALMDWIDRTLIADDEQSFVTPIRDIDLLLRIGWHSTRPETLGEKTLLNPEDLPAELLEATIQPAASVVQCATCRRLCVRDEFAWKDKQLCAWDYHGLVFGKRGPWRNGVYESRHFETLPLCAYVAPPLLEELAVDVLLTTHGLHDDLCHALINEVLGAAPDQAHLAVRTRDGFVVLREREH